MENSEFEKSKAFIIAEILEYIPNSVVTKTISRRATGNISAVAFDSGETLTEKISRFDTFIQGELIIANKELVFQNEEKEKRAAELIIANKELAFQNEEKEKRAAELIIANKELAFQNEEKEKRAAELIIANKELAFQKELKGKTGSRINHCEQRTCLSN